MQLLYGCDEDGLFFLPPAAEMRRSPVLAQGSPFLCSPASEGPAGLEGVESCLPLPSHLSCVQLPLPGSCWPHVPFSFLFSVSLAVGHYAVLIATLLAEAASVGRALVRKLPRTSDVCLSTWAFHSTYSHGHDPESCRL